MQHNIDSIYHDPTIVVNFLRFLTPLESERFALTCKKACDHVRKCKTEVETKHPLCYLGHTGVEKMVVLKNGSFAFPPRIREIVDTEEIYGPTTLPKTVTALTCISIDVGTYPNLERLCASALYPADLMGLQSLTHLSADEIDLTGTETFPPQLTFLRISNIHGDLGDCQLGQMIPRGVTDLTIGFSFSIDGSEHLRMKDLPVGLKTFVIEDIRYRLDPNDYFHPGIKTLIFWCPLLDDDFVNDVGKFPAELETLETHFLDEGWKIDAAAALLKKLPQKLTKLMLDLPELPGSIIDSIPKSVTNLCFRQYSRHHWFDVARLPPNLTKLKFYGDQMLVKKEAVGLLPRSLKVIRGLEIHHGGISGGRRRRVIDFRFLSILEEIKYDIDYDTIVFLPETITSLDTTCNPVTFPPNLKILISTQGIYNKNVKKLPSSITRMDLGSLHCDHLSVLPPNLTELIVKHSYGVVVSHFPPTLTKYKELHSREDRVIVRIDSIDRIGWAEVLTKKDITAPVSPRATD